eukprot:5120199-Amphidinium_carterae.2
MLQVCCGRGLEHFRAKHVLRPVREHEQLIHAPVEIQPAEGTRKYTLKVLNTVSSEEVLYLGQESAEDCVHIVADRGAGSFTAVMAMYCADVGCVRGFWRYDTIHKEWGESRVTP